jgi:hypothetical protein
MPTISSIFFEWEKKNKLNIYFMSVKRKERKDQGKK